MTAFSVRELQFRHGPLEQRLPNRCQDLSPSPSHYRLTPTSGVRLTSWHRRTPNSFRPHRNLFLFTGSLRLGFDLDPTRLWAPKGVRSRPPLSLPIFRHLLCPTPRTLPSRSPAKSTQNRVRTDTGARRTRLAPQSRPAPVKRGERDLGKCRKG